MTNEELKNALFSGEPVRYNGITYRKISAIIYRADRGQLLISAELLDACGNSVTIAPASRVSRSEVT